MSTTFREKCDFLINEHLLCKYFIRLSVGNASKGFCYLWMLSSLFSSKLKFNTRNKYITDIYSSKITMNFTDKIIYKNTNRITSLLERVFYWNIFHVVIARVAPLVNLQRKGKATQSWCWKGKKLKFINIILTILKDSLFYIFCQFVRPQRIALLIYNCIVQSLFMCQCSFVRLILWASVLYIQNGPF